MDLEFKPDFERARARWDKYWRGESFDRPVIRIVLPKPGAPQAKKPGNYAVAWAEDLGPIIEQNLAWAAGLDWLGDAIPGVQITFAPDHFALLLGADMTPSSTREDGSVETVWVEPFLTDYDQEIRFRPECKWWQRTVESIRAFRQRCDGRMLVFWTQLQGGLDALSAIRGPERLLMDLVLCPDDVKEALRQLDQALAGATRALAAELDTARFGSMTRHGMYSTGLLDVPQCDFSAMISPEMFREFGLPSLQRQCGLLDAAEYHLDGPDAIKHLPALAEIKKIKTIQWQPGAGNAAAQDWSALYKQIDELGLGQMRTGSPRQMADLWRGLRARQYLYIAGLTEVATRAQAEAILERWPG
ncbi:MAG TPA: hypothetical protein P5137_09045 [Candidatus Brocadiia bacterium]|nr:hypothetical protein [Candidatus Brocadiia bacterium]